MNVCWVVDRDVFGTLSNIDDVTFCKDNANLNVNSSVPRLSVKIIVCSNLLIVTDIQKY